MGSLEQGWLWTRLDRIKNLRKTKSRSKLIQALEELGVEDQRLALMSEAERLGVLFTDLDHVQPHASALRSLPPETVRRLRVVPLRNAGSTLWVAMEVLRQESIDTISASTGLVVVPVLVLPDSLDRALAVYFPQAVSLPRESNRVPRESLS